MLMIVYRMSMTILTFISLVKMTSVMKVACRRSTIRFTIGAIVSKTEYSHFINCLLVVIVVAFLPLLKIMAVLIFKNFKKLSRCRPSAGYCSRLCRPRVD